MKIQLLSDLHNEFYRPELPPPMEQTDCDLLVLAGDIDVGLKGMQWAREEAQRLGKPLLYVTGNHEFYHHDISLINEMRDFAAENDGLYFLENDELITDGVRFLGCTLWSNYKVTGDQKQSMLEVEKAVSDHYAITNGERLFHPQDALELHMESRSWLEKRLSQCFEGKTVVITHHGPSLLCKHHFFPLNAMASAFISDLSDLVERADVWCFGHTHSNVDTMVGGCRLVSNQRGYPAESVSGFSTSKTIEV